MTDSELPIIPMSLLRQSADGLPCISLKHRGRKPPPYGTNYGCGVCRKPPRYRNSWITDCSCGMPPNPHAPVVLVRFVEDDA